MRRMPAARSECAPRADEFVRKHGSVRMGVDVLDVECATCDEMRFFAFRKV